MSVVKIILRKKRKADGTFPLAIRITKDRKSSYIYLGYHIPEDDWDAVRSRVKKSHSNSTWLNNLILKKLAETNNSVLEIETAREHVSSTAMKQKVKPKGGANFFGQVKLYFKTLKEAGKYNRYNADISKAEHLKEFCGTEDLAFSDITVQFLEKFKHHLITQSGLSERTAINNLVFVRSIYSQAIKSEIADVRNYPFGRGKIVVKFPDTKKVGLSAEDIQKLENVKLIYPIQNHVRNAFLFSFYFGGMRGADLLQLRWSDFKDGRLHYTMGKNLKPVSLKVPEKAVAILALYEAERRHNNDLVFPDLKEVEDFNDKFALQKKISNAICRIDKVLTKKVAAKAGLTGNITMHVARHSFGKIAGDTIALTTAQKLFRHSDITTTMGYMNNFIHKDEDQALDNVINFKSTGSLKRKIANRRIKDIKIDISVDHKLKEIPSV